MAAATARSTVQATLPTPHVVDCMPLEEAPEVSGMATFYSPFSPALQDGSLPFPIRFHGKIAAEHRSDRWSPSVVIHTIIGTATKTPKGVWIIKAYKEEYLGVCKTIGRHLWLDGAIVEVVLAH